MFRDHPITDDQLEAPPIDSVPVAVWASQFLAAQPAGPRTRRRAWRSERLLMVEHRGPRDLRAVGFLAMLAVLLVGLLAK